MSNNNNNDLDIPDLVLLDPLSNHSITQCLSHRFLQYQKIYTAIGDVLLCVNPFQLIHPSYYSEALVRYYYEQQGGSTLRGSAATRHGLRIEHVVEEVQRQTGAAEGTTPTAGPPREKDTLLDGPHIFSLADSMFKTMLTEEENQCVIISGESGAGKTEASKQILFYISKASGYANMGDKSSSGPIDQINAVMMDSNPLLESFGNAKTLRNDNSSRFGKFFKLFFSKNGTPIGGHINIFLLEKNRVVNHQRGERNFHIFYQLCSSAIQTNNNNGDTTKEELHLDHIQQLLTQEEEGTDGDALFTTFRRALGLHTPSQFHYLNQGGLYSSTPNAAQLLLERKDAADWAEVMHAMKTMNMTHRQQKNIIVLLAAILYLGQLEFIETSITTTTTTGGSGEVQANNNNNNTPACILKPNKRQYLSLVALLLQVEEAELLQCLLFKKLTITERKEEVTLHVPHDKQQCHNTRDALAKNIYHYLFNYIVDAVNQALEVPSTSLPKANQKQNNTNNNETLMLGVLDIYGFEVFEHNYFEQLCINYVNEKLQQIFIELTLKKEQEEYKQEGIAWTPIPFFDNKNVCGVLEKEGGGIFSMLDDICATMAKEEESVVDEKILDRLELLLENNPLNENEDARRGGRGEKEKIFKKTDHGFSLQHYAGEVQYTTKGFASSNKDLLSMDLLVLLSRSRNAFLTQVLDPLLDVFFCQKESTKNNKNNNRPQKKFTTAGFKIRQQAKELVATLKKCNPHYIRTIKPNDNKQPGVFVFPRVEHQVHYLGLLENIKVRRAGFTYRNYFDRFVKQYKYIHSRTYPRPFEGTDREAAATILRALRDAAHSEGLTIEFRPSLQVSEDDWQLGKNKLFIKKPQNIFALEEARHTALNQLVRKIQQLYRQYRHRKAYIILREKMNRFLTQQHKLRRLKSFFLEYNGNYLEWIQQDNHNPFKKQLEMILRYDPMAESWIEMKVSAAHKHPNTKKNVFYFNRLTQQTTWEKPPELPQRNREETNVLNRIIFSAAMRQVVPQTETSVAYQKVFVVLTDRYLFLLELSSQESFLSYLKNKKQTERTPVAHPHETEEEPMLLVKKKIDVRLLSEIGFTPYADNVLLLRFFVPQSPYRPVIPSTRLQGGPPHQRRR
ncbi:myosin I [Angomonas deanei]|uniref:Myosin head (Motor domain), putative n=1 Tax=Angomonas deanei TaxID=59799 RepID=A0A7G2C9N9_9TRYP|nr:myosin I [Angomonas deanei]CAD2215714.1 Myosin head (motor domain), putative [Angomonas deanei]|eukprot:EPY31408.1 myosin I [Angomonas deanei]